MSTIRARNAVPAPAAGSAAASPRSGPAEVIVVTLDADLERALRAASSTTPMRVARTPAELADLLMTGRAGALVLDIGALDAAALTVARHLAEQFPEVPLVAVGSREDEAQLAGLISRGLIYRFLHRPLSAARARTFIDAALRRSGEIGSGARPSPAHRPPKVPAPNPRRSLLAVATAVAIATLGLGAWLALRPPPSPPAAPHPVAAATSSGPVERTAAPVATLVKAVPDVVVPSATRDTATPARILTAVPAVPAAPAESRPTVAPASALASAAAPAPAPAPTADSTPDSAPAAGASPAVGSELAAAPVAAAPTASDENAAGAAPPTTPGPDAAPRDPPDAG